MPSSSNAAASSHNEAGDSKMDTLVGYILLIGVWSSLLLIVAGMIWRYVRYGGAGPSYDISGMNLFQFGVAEARSAAHGQIRPRLFIDCGIIVLMLTPYLRVLASVIYFGIVLKNWKYTLFTAIVLGVLTFSLFLR